MPAEVTKLLSNVIYRNEEKQDREAGARERRHLSGGSCVAVVVETPAVSRGESERGARRPDGAMGFLRGQVSTLAPSEIEPALTLDTLPPFPSPHTRNERRVCPRAEGARRTKCHRDPTTHTRCSTTLLTSMKQQQHHHNTTEHTQTHRCERMPRKSSSIAKN